jgi:uncharacterized membrane protein (DUF485 family)
VRSISLRLIGAVGALTFGFFFSLAVLTPNWVEDFAKDFVAHEVQSEVDARIDGLKLAPGKNVFTQAAATIYQKNQVEIDALKTELKTHAHERMTEALAQISDINCECRQKIAKWLDDGSLFAIATRTAENAGLADFIQGYYLRIVDELKRDLRIFTASNAIVFLLLLLASFLRPQATTHLLIPAVLLLAATLLCSYLYVFEQNWLLTIIYHDYLGFAYLGYLGLAFLFLCDVFLNRGRVLCAIVNGLASTLGSAVILPLC